MQLRPGLVICLVLLSVFSSVSRAEDGPGVERGKPFDLGLGVALGWSSDRFLWGLDAIVGKRLANTENWGYGLQYHYISPSMNALYLTAMPLGQRGQFKLGIASVDYLNSANEVGLGVGVAVLEQSWFNGKVHTHLLDLEQIFMPDRSYTIFTVSVSVLTQLR